MKNKYLLIGLSAIVIIILFFIIFTNSSSQSNTTQTNQDLNQEIKASSFSSAEWSNIELKDVRTSAPFKISEFSGKHILVESFAVWCPTCTRQQKEIKALQRDLGNTLISISLDTDASEDESKVRAHIERNEFTSLYAIAPLDLTRSLIDEFGVGIVNAPSAPVILICPDGSYKKLKNGIKTSEVLKTQIASC